jgi:hypothetical protein
VPHAAAAEEPGQAPVRPPGDGRFLQLYLRDHYTASRACLDLLRRSAGAQTDPQVRRELQAAAAAAAEDSAALLGIMAQLGASRSPFGERWVSVMERLGRLKTNGTVLRRSPLSDLLELEALSAALQMGKQCWLSLQDLSAHDDRLNAYQLTALLSRAEERQTRLESLRRSAARRVLGREGAAPHEERPCV